ncbi:MAG: hypothetical protein WCG07_03015, partial [Candidatus Taylorbacteria bacterium]
RSTCKERVEQGVTLPNKNVGRGHVEVLNDHLFPLFVTDHGPQIREMYAELFAEIEQLTRISILNVRMGRLESNAYRTIDGDELTEFLSALGL